MNRVEREQPAEKVGRELAVAGHDATRGSALEQAVNVDDYRAPVERFAGDDVVELSCCGTDRLDFSRVEDHMAGKRARHRAGEDEADQFEGVGRHVIAGGQAKGGTDDLERSTNVRGDLL